MTRNEVITSGALFLLPITLKHLSSRPQTVGSRLDRLREKLAEIKDDSINQLGEKNWFVISEVIVKNIWISNLALCFLLNKHTSESSQNRVVAASSSICLASLSWGIRFGLQACLKKVSQSCLRRLNHSKSNKETSLVERYINSDPVLGKHLCPITQGPIREAARDPHDGKNYDRSAIAQWLKVHPTSPMTRKPLSVWQLQSNQGLQALIDHRIDWIKRKINEANGGKNGIE